MKIAKDKKVHFFVCTITAVVVMAFMRILSSPLVVGVLASQIASICLGVGKEYGDHASPNNHWDWYDLLADVLGALFGSLIGCLFWLL